ncbi:MAG: DUF4968 domain-containing protein [Treponema sp.]|nr:DUF4968 domain-containing protein [Treponema sp.]
MLTPIPPKNSCITHVKIQGNNVFLYSESGVLRVAVYEPEVFRISFNIDETFDVEQGSEFLGPAAAPEFSVEETEVHIFIKTPVLICKICRDSSSVSFVDTSDKVLFSEALEHSHILEQFDVYKTCGNIKTEEIKTADGVKKKVIAADKVFDKTLFHTRLDFCFDEEEKLFGLGQAEEGCWNLRSTTQYLNQANKKIAIPFLISSKGYGILFTTQSPSIFSDTQYGSYFYTTADYYLDYFFIGQKPVAAMRRLTGKALLPPKWALGYIQSQERYESEQEILDTAAEFKKRGIPVSAIVLDWLSWEDGMWGQKSLDKKRFPSPEKMIETLHKDDIHFMISIWPSMDEKSENYKEMKEHNTLLPGVNICNAFDKAARELYWKQAKEGLAKYGVESWWCDSSEPVTPEWNHLEPQLPQIQFNEYVNATSDIMPVEKSNAYGYYHALGMYEGQKKDYPDRRMLILTRSGWSGSQRLGVTLWSGDTSASWKTLQNQLVEAIQFSMSGIPYWTFDIGAFFVKKGINWYWNGDYDDTTKNPGYRELYTRWFQLGAFLPMFRAHGTDCRREPWAFEDKTNIFYNAISAFIKLRYSLMPYIYSVAASVWKNDEMFIRPLFMEFKDKAVLDISSQFMFGPAIMVCPVTMPMYYDKAGNPIDKEKSIKVYLPADCGWYDWWTGKKYDGGQWITTSADISKIPLFVREGSTIPTSTDLLRFPDSHGNCKPFELYEDDGISNDYQNGEFSIKFV